MTKLTKVEFTIDKAAGDELAAFLSSRAPQGWEEDETETAIRCVVFAGTEDRGRELARDIESHWPESKPHISEQEQENWAMAWKDFFVPVSCGERFEVLPPWLTDKGDPNLTPIIIEPKMAFGTGHHASTALCLGAIADHLGKKPAYGAKFLDLGTGSGILGIALCTLGMAGVGLDIDPEAIDCAEENAQTNGVADDLALAVGSVDCLDSGLLFEVIVANILSGPLIEMAPDITDHLATGGCLILSGILAEQADTVSAAYMACGLAEPEVRIEGEWAALSWPEALRP